MEPPTSALPTLATIDLVIIAASLVLVVAIGFFLSGAASRGIDDYFLGGKKIPWWMLGISTAASNFDMAGTMIIVAVVFALGFQGFLVELRGGVGLSLAFILVFVSKWLRRSRVMTSAEWMKLRFGTARQGQTAHILSAVANIVLSLGMIIYFAKGAGKFLTHFLPFSELTCTAVMVGIGLFYTLAAGLYGVVFTDVFQMIVLVLTALFISVKGFALVEQVTLPQGFVTLGVTVPEGAGAALLAKDAAAWEPVLTMFGACVAMWFARTFLEGLGGVGGYTDQRFFAARNEREASLLTLESILLSVFRWTLIAGLVIMGYALVQTNGPGAALIAGDAEQVLPVVLGHYLPAGFRGLVIAGLIAAAMSTFDSTLNAGAAYVVRDLYQGYLRPQASERQLVRVSRLATIVLCVLGIGFAAIVPNINQIWGLITMGIGAGMFVPLFLRWLWPRFNGYGFALGTGGGMLAALIVDAGLGWPLVASFPTVIGVAVLASVGGTLLSAPTPTAVLARFYAQVNPWGPWRRIAAAAVAAGWMGEAEVRDHRREVSRGLLALVCAVPFQFCILLAAMSVMFHAWTQAAAYGAVTLVAAVGLYLTWFRHLKDERRCAADDQRFADLGDEAGPR